MTSQFNGQNIVAQGRWGGPAGESKNTKGAKITQNTVQPTGVYDLTLEQPLALGEYVIGALPEQQSIMSSTDLTAKVKQIFLRDTTNANLNGNFTWTVFQMPGT
jgi:hypothetical protein